MDEAWTSRNTLCSSSRGSMPIGEVVGAMGCPAEDGSVLE
jgi:hypothetical protein